MNDFANAIRKNREPLVNSEEGLRSIEIVRAIYESNGEKIIDLA